RDDCLSAIVLGAAVRFSIGVSGGRSSRIHQLLRQHRRIFWAEDFWKTESGHRLFQYWLCGHDRMLGHRIVAGSGLSARAKRAKVHGVEVKGVDVDLATSCAHPQLRTDI